MTIRVAALTSGRDTPSSRFRIRQHIGPLRACGIEVTEYLPAIDKFALLPGVLGRIRPAYIFPVAAAWQVAKAVVRLPDVVASRKADIVWLEREILPGYVTLEGVIKKPYVLDVDDAVWMYGRFGRSATARTARGAAMVLAGNSYLADWYAKFAKSVRVVPTGVDTLRYAPRDYDHSGADDRFRIGWTGVSHNFVHLYAIEKALSLFLRNHPLAELNVMADRAPAFRSIPADRVRFLPWDPIIEASALRDWDVGIMPLSDDEWTRGKCGFKLLQYMATALPSVVSPVGMNSDILAQGRIGIPASDDEEWYEALDRLHRDPALRREMGMAGREIVEKNYSREVVSRTLAEVFRELS